MHEMNEKLADDPQGIPTHEQLAARQLRLLRQGRNWSQLEVAEKMRAYGYQWSQATVTRLEAATRPIRLNELAALAALYGVPVAQFLEPGAPDDFEVLEREIEQLRAQRAGLAQRLEAANSAAKDLHAQGAEAAALMARIDGRLASLMRWHPRAKEGGGIR
jgi:transcriptional regulator with XRE-family HTH domain